MSVQINAQDVIDDLTSQIAEMSKAMAFLRAENKAITAEKEDLGARLLTYIQREVDQLPLDVEG